MPTPDPRDVRRARPAPTAVRRAIAEGTRHLVTEAEVTDEILDERSTPVNLTAIDRVEWRQRQMEANTQELARAVGDLRLTSQEHSLILGGIQRILEQQDARESRKEAADVALAVKKEERAEKADNQRTTSREKILLAVIAALVTLGGGYLLTRTPDAIRPTPTMTSPVSP